MKEIKFTQEEIDQMKSDVYVAIQTLVSYVQNSVISEKTAIIECNKIKSYQSILDKLS